MKGYNHVIVSGVALYGLERSGIVPAIPVVLGGHLFDLRGVIYIGVMFGALIPDIDNARSMLGRRVRPISMAIAHHGGHRGITHSLLGVGLWVIFALFLLYGLQQFGGSYLPLPAIAWLYASLIIGQLLHLLEDAVTYGGIPILFPSPQRYGIPPWPHIRMKSGGKIEWCLVVALVTLMLWDLQKNWGWWNA